MEIKALEENLIRVFSLAESEGVCETSQTTKYCILSNIVILHSCYMKINNLIITVFSNTFFSIIIVRKKLHYIVSCDKAHSSRQEIR